MRYTQAEIEKAIQDLSQRCAVEMARLVTLLNDNGHDLSVQSEIEIFLMLSAPFAQLITHVNSDRRN